MVPKISIIVPVYKAELYLHRCVDSLLSQTFRDFEVLLIDDGSPDKSGEICEEYAQQDSRVRVFHKSNGGVSSARQKGLDEACGEYVIHADPDDWVEPTMLEELYRKAKKEDADMVICDYFDNYKDKQSLVVQKPSALDHNTVLRELFQQLHGSCCNKLVRRVCYNEYKIKFPLELSLCEDFYVIASLLKQNIRVAYLPEAFYHYVHGENTNTLVGSHYPLEKLFLLENIMSDLLQGTCAENLAKHSFMLNTVRRAFIDNVLSSRQFKYFFYSYRHLLKYDGSHIFKYFIYFSCLGFYKPMRILWAIIKSFNRKS